MVKIHDGWLRGVVRHRVASFKDIPFAAPPVGELRWRAPQPAGPWRGIRDASAYGPECLQMSMDPSEPVRGRQSEDCLTINVVIPAHRPTGANLAVMVWIYGGGFREGSASDEDGTNFARDGVVLVTFNYRLGRLGFFAHPALAKTNPEGALSDYGFADQIAALKWVRENISAFGGDPDRVTIFGESAGATSVNYLLVSPAARGLFSGAIAESGYGRQPGHPLAQAEAIGAAFIKSLGISGDGEAAARAMRALPAKALMAPIEGLGVPAAGAIIDGVIARESPGEGFAKGDQAHVPYLAGGNSFEASLLSGYVSKPEMLLDRLGSARAAAVARLGDGDPTKAAETLFTLAGDIEPDRYLAREDARRGVPAYLYYFAYVPAAERARSKGVGHGDEIAYVFDTLPRTATSADRAMARAAHAYWVAFAGTGRPDSGGGAPWPKAEPNDVYMVFANDGPHAVPGFDKAKLDFAEAVNAAQPQ
ncbi:MAG: carboxylesterase/lipase family protein [Mycobacteriales bacterium]